MRAYRKIKTTNADVDALQTQLEQVVNPLIRITLLDGAQVSNVAITTSGVVIEHGLGRTPLGWIVTDNSADNRIWRTAWDKFTLTLDAAGSSTISIWVY